MNVLNVYRVFLPSPSSFASKVVDSGFTGAIAFGRKQMKCMGDLPAHSKASPRARISWVFALRTQSCLDSVAMMQFCWMAVQNS